MAQAQVISFSEPFTNANHFIVSATGFIRENIKPEDKIFLPVSGGIDSRVVYELFKKAIDPKRIYPVHIDTNFMRIINGLEEPQLVAKSFEGAPNFKVVDERERFSKNTFGIDDHKWKRKAFKTTYGYVIRELVEKYECNKGSDGTIGPDKVETKGGTYKGVKLGEIKDQHNVGDDPFEMKIEPLATLSKDEVRIVGRRLGITEDLLLRQPFPGPGLSIRILGSIDEKKLDAEKISNDIVEQEVEKHFKEIYGKPFIYDSRYGERIPFQYFAATIDPSLDNSTSLREEINEYVKGLVGKNLIVDCNVLKAKATGMKIRGDRFERTYEPLVRIILDKKVDPFVVSYIGENVPEEFPVSRVLKEIASGSAQDTITSVRVVRSRNALAASPIMIPNDYGLIQRIYRNTPGVGSICVDITSKPPGTIEYE